jgi:RNA polymerase sigma factor (sigma-70 family)
MEYLRRTRGKALGNRRPIPQYKYSLSDSELYEPSFFTKEIFLDNSQWQDIAEDKLPWYEYNRRSRERKEAAAIHRMILPCIREIIASGLTRRQKEVVTMYFLHDHTQVYIAHELGISQPTVSQHLNGKKRNGKKIGGSIRKIRKMIHYMSSTDKEHQSEFHIINILDKLLDKNTSIRKSHKLIHNMLKKLFI